MRGCVTRCGGAAPRTLGLGMLLLLCAALAGCRTFDHGRVSMTPAPGGSAVAVLPAALTAGS